MAAALGLALSHQVHAAAVTVTPVQSTTYTLTPGANPITFGQGTNINTSANNPAVYGGAGTQWNVTNNGNLNGTFAVVLESKSTFTNTGATNGYVSLNGGGNLINKAGATIAANGSFGDSTVGVRDGTVTNGGTIEGATAVVIGDGGSVINQLGGNIRGGVGGYGVHIGGFDSPGTVTNAGRISGSTAVALKNGGSITNQASGTIIGTGFGAQLAGGGSITNAGTITGTRFGGVLIQSGGNFTNQTHASVIGGYWGADVFGGIGNITNAGTIVATTNGYGVGAELVNGGNVTNLTSGTITGASRGIVLFEGGNIVNQTGGKITGGKYGVVFTAGVGNVTNAGAISGGVASVLFQASGANTLNNSGLITTAQSGHAGLAIGMSDGTGSVNNSKTGVIDGLIEGPGSITFNNAGTWGANGVSGFGAASRLGSLNNTGLIQVGLTTASPAATSSVFGSLGRFNNGSAGATGTISMANGTPGDSLAISARFVGASGHSALYLDAFLGGPGSIADRLNLTGSSGLTLIRINDTNKGSGALNSAGIVLVTGSSSASNFALDPTATNYDSRHKGIDHGLFLYSLAYHAGNEVLIGTAGAAALQLPSALSASQQIWQSTSIAPIESAASGGGANLEGDEQADRPRVWMKAVNGASDDASATQPLFSMVRASYGLDAASLFNQVNAGASGSGFDTGYSLGTAMIIGGVDLVHRQNGLSRWSLGLASGYVDSDQAFATGAEAMTYSGAVFGAYAAYRSDGLSLDASIKSDMLKVRYEAQWLGADRPGARLTTTGAELDASYGYPLNVWLTIEPVASAAVDVTAMGDLQLGSSIAHFDPSVSGWVNMGVRLKGQVRRGAYAISGSLTTRLWDQFSSGDTAFLSDLGPATPLSERIDGLSGEIGERLTVARSNRAEGFISSTIRYGVTRQSASALAGFIVHW